MFSAFWNDDLAFLVFLVAFAQGRSGQSCPNVADFRRNSERRRAGRSLGGFTGVSARVLGWFFVNVMRFGAHLLTSIHPNDRDVKIERVTLKGWIPDLAPVGDEAVRTRGDLTGFSDWGCNNPSAFCKTFCAKCRNMFNLLQLQIFFLTVNFSLLSLDIVSASRLANKVKFLLMPFTTPRAVCLHHLLLKFTPLWLEINGQTLYQHDKVPSVGFCIVVQLVSSLF